MDYSFLLRPETIPRTLTDYQRHSHAFRGNLALACAALALCACSSPADDTVAPSTPRAELVVAGQLVSDELVEASGLARSQRSPDLLWSINDGGSKAHIYALDGSGFHRGRIKLDDIKNRDWEDLSSFSVDGTPYLLVADTGDNDARRDQASLHVVLEPDLDDDNKVKTDPAWSIDFRYPDGPRDVEAYRFGLGNFRNAEAIAFSADSKSIFVTLEGRHAPLLRIDINGALPE